MPGARLWVYDQGQNLVGTAVLDATGAYTVTGLIEGTYTFMADGSAAGYLPATGVVEVGPDRVQTQDLALTPAPGSVTGLVADPSTGLGIRGTEVQLIYSDGSRLAGQTSGVGEYVLGGVAAEVPITVTALALPPSYRQGAASTVTGTVPAGGSATANLLLQPNRGTLQGRVTDMVSGAALAGASLELYDAKNNLLASGASDASGGYALREVPAGSYSLSLSRSRYWPASYQVRVGPGATTDLVAVLAPLAGSIAGTVLDALTRQAVRGATVELLDSSQTALASALSDRAGSFTFPAVTPGAYTLRANHPDYTTGATAEAQVTLAPEGSVARELHLTPRPGAIGGRVTSATTGQGIARAAVRLYDSSQDLAGFASTDASGYYAISNVTAGALPYSLVWSAAGYLPSTGLVAVRANQSAVRNLALAPVEGSIRGTVTDSITGKVVRGATVEVRDPSGALLATTRASTTGGYLFIGLPTTDPLTVSATAPNYNTIAASRGTAPVGTVSSAAARPRSPAQTSATIDLQLQPYPANITGTAKDSQTGNALAGATVQLFDSNNNVVATSTADATGTYTFTSVLVGSYTISVSRDGYLPESQAVELEPGQAAAKDVSMASSAGSVSGKATSSSTGQPIVGATVVLTDTAGITRLTLADAAGTYAFAGLSPGTYRVGASHASYDALGASSSNVILLAAQGATIVLSLSPRTGTLMGTVTDASTGQPLAGSTVEVKNSAGSTVAIYVTGAAGTYLASGLAPGAYPLSASRSGYLSQASQATVEPTQTATKDFPLAPQARSISGAVSQATTGAALAGATVELLDSTGGVVSTATTSASGGYVLADITPGSYTVRARHEDYNAGSGASAAVTVTAGAASIQDLRLEPKRGAMEVAVVHDATGQPIGGATITISTAQGLVASLTTNALGQATRGDLAGGPYTVTASTTGRAGKSAAVTVQPNRTATVRLRLGYLVQALVLETETNQPIPGAMVLLTTSEGSPVAAGTTQADGRLALDITAAGAYTITASAANYDQLSQSATSGSLSSQSPSLSATLYLSRRKAPHLVVAISRFRPQVLPFEVRRPASAGEPIYYAINYNNSGTAAAWGVVITDTIPLGATFLGPPGWSRVDDRTYVYSVGSLTVGASGGVQLVVARDVGLSRSAVFTNTATIGDDGTSGRDLYPADVASDVLTLYRLFLPLVSKAWAGGW